MTLVFYFNSFYEVKRMLESQATLTFGYPFPHGGREEQVNATQVVDKPGDRQTDNKRFQTNKHAHKLDRHV